MTKKTLIDAIAQRLNVSRMKANNFYEAFQSIMLEQVIHDNTFTLHGIGSFKVKDRLARQGRNPRTGETMHIPARKALSFKASAALISQLNDGP